MSKGWHAELELGFEHSHEVTRLMRRRHVGPLAVQQPFYPEKDGSAHVYLLHPPGGVAGEDVLDISCFLGRGSKAVLTTPGATKFYRSDRGRSIQTTRINVGEGGVCEYLPQETIVFDGAKASISTHVSLSGDAVYLGWDIVSLGRPACRENFDAGELRQRVEIFRDGRPIWFEQFRLQGADQAMNAAFAFCARPIVATMVYAGPAHENTLQRIREALGDAGKNLFSVSQLERVIVCRYLGGRMSEAKALFRKAWEVIRETGLGKPAAAPRIWAT
ncbi:urease accessory protein [Ochrobactrum sp. RH1CCR137]|uniref:urease accessory protein UreD n=1 Tax=Brucella intermedia TaxID=94625 RepID=UPI000DE46F0F|nr:MULTISPECIES: urease accessory protein UreD [Brucella/Ochrobactrum group]MBA8842757.1 urease accessory protein [Ochrobactrum sp. RH1CCR137]MBA8854650.1 urease accessory protein [Ochrobactrum sp. RH1CCR134]MCB4918206.1 urease accessory protein UreD [Brucella intermedia]